MRQFRGRRRPRRSRVLVIRFRFSRGCDRGAEEYAPIIVRAGAFQLQFEATTGWIPQLDRESARLGIPSIGKSRRHIGARDREDGEVRPVRRDRSDALDRCAGFRKNPAFDPGNLPGGDFDAFDVNPGSIFHFAQAGQWKRIVQPQGGPGDVSGLRARSSKPAANRFWNSCGRVRSALKPGGGSDFRFQKCAHCSSRLLASCDCASAEAPLSRSVSRRLAARKPRVKPGEKFPLTAHCSISKSRNHSRRPNSVALKKCRGASWSGWRKAVCKASAPPGLSTRRISRAARVGSRRCSKTLKAKTRSKLLSRKGSAWASPTTSVWRKILCSSSMQPGCFVAVEPAPRCKTR